MATVDKIKNIDSVRSGAVFVGGESSKHREAGLAWPCWRRQLEVISC